MDWFVDVSPSLVDESKSLQKTKSADLSFDRITAAFSVSDLTQWAGLSLLPTGSMFSVPFGMSMATGALVPPPVQLYRPQQDSFAELIFPGFDGDSFIWKMSVWQIAEFLFSVAAGQDRGSPSTCTLYNLGASWGPSIASGQIWRLILPMTLHANMMHLFFNIFFQLRIGFGIEKQFGWKKFVTLYGVCGILGNLISVAADPYKLAVGASTAGFGLIGVWMAEIALSWHVMGPNRDRTMVWIAFMLSAVVMMSTSTSNVDLFGHLGGALAGFLVAVLLSDMPDQYKPVWYDEFKRLCKVALGAIVIGCAGKVFMLTPHGPLPQCGATIARLVGHA